MKDYVSLLSNGNVKAFLALIKYTEGAGYQTLFGGAKFGSFDDHPRQVITRNLGGKPITSTAAGAYQFLSRTWDECANACNLPDFSPASQDIAALFLIDRRKALDPVLSGDWSLAIARCNREWASLPGSPYGQPTKSMAACLAFLNKQMEGGGAVATDTFQSSTTGETIMAPFIAAAIPALMSAAPSLIRLFGNSEQAERNAKAAEAVAEIAKQVTGEPTIEGASIKLQADQESADKFNDAIQSNWFELAEAGGGGIAGARKANEAYLRPDAMAFWKTPAFWISAILMSMVFMLLVDVFYVHPERYDGNLQTQVVTALLLIIGMVSSYWLGTSASSQRKTEIMSK